MSAYGEKQLSFSPSLEQTPPPLAGMYGAAAAGMGGAGYSQTPSSYTPARGYSTAPMGGGGGGGGAAADYGKDRSGANRQQAYHPYRRNQ